MDIKILNKKETKRVLDIINEQFGSELEYDKAFFLNKDDVYMVNRECFDRQQPSWRVNSLGLYLGEMRNNQFRPSIEGSQIIGKTAKLNIMELSQEQLYDWISGTSFEIDTPDTGFQIIKYNNNFYGSGKIKNQRMLNFVPKERRISTVA